MPPVQLVLQRGLSIRGLLHLGAVVGLLVVELVLQRGQPALLLRGQRLQVSDLLFQRGDPCVRRGAGRGCAGPGRLGDLGSGQRSVGFLPEDAESIEVELEHGAHCVEHLWHVGHQV